VPKAVGGERLKASKAATIWLDSPEHIAVLLDAAGELDLEARQLTEHDLARPSRSKGSGSAPNCDLLCQISWRGYVKPNPDAPSVRITAATHLGGTPKVVPLGQLRENPTIFRSAVSREVSQAVVLCGADHDRVRIVSIRGLRNEVPSKRRPLHRKDVFLVQLHRDGCRQV
jgi:hypothetical protein